ncbi:hypothetical protein SAMN05216232_1495 [Virgibacillus subterraneus]|uniref:DUF4367 domain-containing protein n=1 Tax=Virgibacillus subterraneus TaxID=621109 RepID=A0A1H9C8C8_9BACI|nr:hypothetical protein [Virgibacillus subterraneus]SEP97515.1 hypothetical protein SAMN05216232_1495 [Virgibacillus subterraneus]
MNEKELDKKIEDELKKDTNSASELKNETWNKINTELFQSPDSHKKKVKKRGIISGLTAAAIVAIAVFGMTDPGQAMIQSLKDMFVEEKEQEIEIEGHKEDSDVQLEANEELRYVIYIDDSRYRMIEGDSSDRIVPEQELADRYPEVSMEIMRKEATTEEMVESIKNSLADNKMELRQEEQVNTPINGVVIRGIGPGYTNEAGKTGQQWDTPIEKYYITETKNNQVFVIKQSYFLEAAEGHGARFDYMLKSFEIVD